MTIYLLLQGASYMESTELQKIEPTIKIDNGIRYIKVFNLTDHIPEVGETIDGQPVKAVEKYKIDPVNNTDEIYQYDYYEITILDKDGDDFYIPLAIKNVHPDGAYEKKSLLFRIVEALQK